MTTAKATQFYRHRKTGGVYSVLGVGKMQSSQWLKGKPRVVNDGDGHFDVMDEEPVDMEEVVVYFAVDGSLWVRPRAEFEDGRFIELPRSPSMVPR